MEQVKKEMELILYITDVLKRKFNEKSSFTLGQLVDEIYKSEQFGKYSNRDKLFSEVEHVLNHFMRSEYFVVKRRRYYPTSN